MSDVHFVRQELEMNDFIYVLSIAERELNLIVVRGQHRASHMNVM